MPYGRFVEEVELHVPRFGLTITDTRYALARDGLDMFGVLTCANGQDHADYALALGLRPKLRPIPFGRNRGRQSRTFVCDNLAFSGGGYAPQAHGQRVPRPARPHLPHALEGQSSMQSRIHAEIAAMKARELSPETADHLMVESIRRGVIPASQLPLVMEAWNRPQHEEFKPDTAWSLFNAFTEVQKSRSPRVQMESGLRLSSTFRSALAL